MILTTERLVLREFVVEDLPAILAYQSDPRYLRYYEWTGRTPGRCSSFCRCFSSSRRNSHAAGFSWRWCCAPAVG